MTDFLGAHLPEVRCIVPKSYPDNRGVFWEAWHSARYEALGVPGPFVQDNVSRSRRGVLRGLHFQHPSAQGKLVSALEGEVFDVAVDIRRGSPTFGRWTACVLSAANGRQLFIPPGFAHGFVALSDEALFHYKCTDYYSPADERTVRWDDPDIAIDWPVTDPVLSDKDRAGVLLRKLGDQALPAHP
jgi:dTDP-4-dehydrorhamnose 3,5-epimerase